MLARLALGLLFVTCAAFAQDESWKADSSGLAPIPKLAAHVTDETGTLSATDRQ